MGSSLEIDGSLIGEITFSNCDTVAHRATLMPAFSDSATFSEDNTFGYFCQTFVVKFKVGEIICNFTYCILNLTLQFIKDYDDSCCIQLLLLLPYNPDLKKKKKLYMEASMPDIFSYQIHIFSTIPQPQRVFGASLMTFDQLSLCSSLSSAALIASPSRIL